MSQKKQSRSQVLLTLSYSLSGLLVITMLILLFTWLVSRKDENSSGTAAASTGYVVAEKILWSIEPTPTAQELLNPEKADSVREVKYAVEPAETLGRQTVAVMLRLSDGTVRTENVVFDVKEAVLSWEKGTDFSASALLGEAYADAQLAAKPSDFAETGTFSVDVTLPSGTFPFTLLVQDTIKPVVQLRQPLSFSVNQMLTPDDFVESCTDASEVAVMFENEPDTTVTGVKMARLIITDAAGNATTLDAAYEVTGDGVAPVFEGCVDLTTIEGVAISYTHNAKAIDDVDGEVAVTATESNGLNIKTPGEYEITYSATDSSGNTGTKTVKLTVLPKDTDLTKIDQEMYMLMGYAITDELFRDADPDMSEKERAYKCYRYVQDHMYFVDNKNEYEDLDTQWMYPAALAIRQKYGDCRNYYGFARLLYTCAGIENLMVFHPANTANADRHWWNMIKIDGEWWHADPTPRVGISNFFMKTDAWMDNYSAKNGNCFKRDKSLYPATPTA